MKRFPLVLVVLLAMASPVWAQFDAPGVHKPDAATMKAIAEKTKRLAKYQCQYCGPTCQGTVNLQAHHLHYRTLYRERPGVDVECVCGNCHEYISFPQADNDNEP